MSKRYEEKRRFLRLTAPVELEYTLENGDKINRAVSKNLSALGISFTSRDKIATDTIMAIKLKVPNLKNPVHMTGKVVWAQALSAEDETTLDIGVEFIQIEEDNKNTFLKYLCDLIYG
ncbi:MAG: PilZ domain-containing protein [Candidatus Omnitrophota bacterium]